MIFHRHSEVQPSTMSCEGRAVNPNTGSPHRRMLTMISLALLMGILFFLVKPDGNFRTVEAEAPVAAAEIEPDLVQGAAENKETSVIAPFFTEEVKYWAPAIHRWSSVSGLDPNIIATIMQVESCGDPLAQSGAGAMGLFQVMPFHFSDGEDGFDPETNSHRGINYYLDRLNQTDGDIGFAFAGYNGGHVAAGSTWDYWAPETQSYYIWTTGIMQDVTAGQQQSETLQRWLQAGGASLCRQASSRLGLG